MKKIIISLLIGVIVEASAIGLYNFINKDIVNLNNIKDVRVNNDNIELITKDNNIYVLDIGG